MKNRPPHEPTTPVKPDTRGRADAPPPAPPHELSHEMPRARQFEHEGRMWMARLSGKAAFGTGSYGLGLIEAIHFCAADEPERPLREALIARGRFEGLYDVELTRLLKTARPIETRSP